MQYLVLSEFCLAYWTDLIDSFKSLALPLPATLNEWSLSPSEVAQVCTLKSS